MTTFKVYQSKTNPEERILALELPEERKARTRLLASINVVLLDEGDFISKSIGGFAYYSHAKDKFNQRFEEVKE